MRIYPVPFRRLDETEQYRKFDWIETDFIPSKSDPRPETYHPADLAKLVPSGHMGTDDDWRERRKFLLERAKVFDRLDPLMTGAKENALSLAVFKTAKIRDFIWEEDEREWKPEKLAQMRDKARQVARSSTSCAAAMLRSTRRPPTEEPCFEAPAPHAESLCSEY
jgi:hypothetical protein